MNTAKSGFARAPFRLWALYLLALSVSMGVALVSIAKLLILLAVIWKGSRWLWSGGIQNAGTQLLSLQWARKNWTFAAILLALSWMTLTWFWSEGSPQERWNAWVRHARIWVVPAVFYLIETRAEAIKVLAAVVVGQLFVVASSWLMWLGVPLIWAFTGDSPALGVVFASTLEQPIMSTLMLVLVWFYRQDMFKRWQPVLLGFVALLTLANVFFVMTGRTGYLTMLVAVGLMLFFSIKSVNRWVLLAAPVVLATGLWTVSERFQSRVLLAKNEVVNYQQKGDTQSSQGLRLDYWMKSLAAWEEAPILGHGVGSWRGSYIRLNGADKPNPPFNPHQQYLLWAVEAGVIGLVLILLIFVALVRDALRMQALQSSTQKVDSAAEARSNTASSHALLTVAAIAFVTGLMNCPFLGAGIGEFFFVLMGAILASSSQETIPTQAGQAALPAAN